MNLTEWEFAERIGLPSNFILSTGSEIGETILEKSLPGGVRYVVFEGGGVWFCMKQIEGYAIWDKQCRSRREATDYGDRDAKKFGGDYYKGVSR